MVLMNDGPRKRRSLSHVGGRTDTVGPRAEAEKLAHALDVAPATDAEDDPARSHVHGFHTYPARMHPTTAARLVRAFAPPGGRVFDPFCGSGTVLVEAMLAGRAALGSDLNPLAVRLARCKTRPRTEPEVEYLVARAAEVVQHAEDRRRARAGATRRYPPEDVELFDPHVLLELDSLRAKIETLPDEPTTLDLALVLSAILMKVSRRPGDTSGAVVGRKIRAGFAAKLFMQKAEDWATRLGAFSRGLPAPPPPRGDVSLDDATVLKAPRDGAADAAVTSPPYAATYDYLYHHELRLRWLGLDAGMLARGEIGGRAAYRRMNEADGPAAWAWELSRFLRAVHRVLKPGSPLVLVMADSAVRTVAIRADAIAADVAPGCGFEPVARASQPRPHFHEPSAAAFRDRPRFEHAILLRRG
jgi:SAM-dependent methyltransferase